MEHGGLLYQGKITIDDSCYNNLTDTSSDDEVADALDVAVKYDWHLQRLHSNIDKDEWIGFWRRYNLLQFFSNNPSVPATAPTLDIDRDEVKMYYPGLEDIVDLLLDNDISFGLEGDVDLTDADGIVLASAGMLIRDSKIAIDPTDETSKAIFESAGYRVIRSNDFDINEIKTNNI